MNTSYGASNLFGHQDYYQALNSGMSNQQILSWINSNMGQLSKGPKNQPGGGGLYDEIQAANQKDKMLAADKAAKQQQLQQQQAAMAQLQQSFDARMAAVNAQMLEQQQSYSSTLAEQTAKFNATQQAQQAQYATDLRSMQDTFSQKYSQQNQLYAGNLAAVRNELTARQEKQSEKYASNILNMQNTYNTNRLAQEQKYNDNILNMQNTFKEQQKQLKDTLNSKANPHTRQTQVGVQAPDAKDKAGAAKLQARGTKGSFNRAGLRIQGLNI